MAIRLVFLRPWLIRCVPGDEASEGVVPFSRSLLLLVVTVSGDDLVGLETPEQSSCVL